MVLLLLIIPLTLIIIMGSWIYNIDLEIQQRLNNKNILAPTVFYSDAIPFKKDQFLPPSWRAEAFDNYRIRENEQNLFPGDQAILTSEQCSKLLSKEIPPNQSCFAVFLLKSPHPKIAGERLQVAVLSETNLILEIFSGTPLLPSLEFYLPPKEVAQYLGKEPILKSEFNLSQVPSACLNAVTAIEDQNFLKHSGISFTGIFRALFKNLILRRAAQGGSTITQQLAKNYFLTPEKTLQRKITEFIMAVLIEARFTKDQIIETYLNIIYLGQQGTFQVRGYGAASKFYFDKNLADLNLSECALLGAIVNSPGNYNPWIKAENAKKRRTLVLSKMLNLKQISEQEYEQAVNFPLPSLPKTEISGTAPYFIDASIRELENLGYNTEGVTVFTTMSVFHQKAAQSALNDHLLDLELNHPKVSKISKDKHKTLEGVFVSLENPTGSIRSLVGGRSYKKSQFNRVLDSERSIGSTIKPFVYLTAGLKEGFLQEAFSPVFPVEDIRFTHNYEGQKWSPENYDKIYHGKIPAYYGLKNSLNAAAGKLGIQLTPESVIETLRQFGITAPMQAVPSISLGTFAIKPIELLQAYSILARYGIETKLHFNSAIIDADGDIHNLESDSSKEIIDPKKTAILVSMMKQTVLSGTAKGASKMGFNSPAAGKTGTTNDNRDTWFVGFTPYLTALTWTGFDDNSSTGLTGANGSLPIWVNFFKTAQLQFPDADFPTPEDCEIKNIDEAFLIDKKLRPENEDEIEPAQLLFCED